MEATSIHNRNNEIFAQKFHAALDALPKPLFAVLDGGQVDDLEDELAEVGVGCRPLFLEGGDENIRQSGPLLVALDDSQARIHVEKLAIEKPCAVFWSCSAGEQALWRHLRTINEVLIPDGVVSNNEDYSGRIPKYERVLFRHWDPNILGSILPLFDLEQFARVFGPAQTIFMNATNYGGFKRAPRPQNLPKAPNGALTIRADQMKAIEAQSRASYCRRMSPHLRAMAAQETAGMNEAELNERVMRYEASGNRLGLTQERSLSIWGFLMIISGDRFEHLPEIRKFIQAGPGSPDENVETLLDQMTRLANTMEEVS